MSSWPLHCRNGAPAFGLTQIQSMPPCGVLRAVCFDGDVETVLVDRVDQRRIELQQWLAAGEDHKAPRRVTRPSLRDGAREFACAFEAAAAGPIGADEIGIAELADGGGAVLFAAGPQIAAGETAEHGGAAGLGALALQRLEDFFDGVGHVPLSAGIICVSLSRGTRAALREYGRPKRPRQRPRHSRAPS